MSEALNEVLLDNEVDSGLSSSNKESDLSMRSIRISSSTEGTIAEEVKETFIKTLAVSIS
jgi:hypothetical protein